MLEKLKVFIVTSGITLFITIVTTMVLIALTVAGFFLPQVYKFIVEKHFFDIIALACLLEIIFILLRDRRLFGAWIFLEDLALQNKIIEILKMERIQSIDIISAGLASRTGLIPEILAKGYKVRLLAQHPEAAIDKQDGWRVRDSISVIRHLKSEEVLQNLTIKYCLNPVSVRAMILHGKPFAYSYAVIGWYTYHEAGRKVKGRGNPSLFVSTASLEGRELITFAQQVFDKSWNSETESQTWKDT